MEKKPVPIVSVIIPTHNRAPLISQAIESVLRQTCQDFEIIVVDDASTDNTEEVVKGLNDLRIRYLRLERNHGAPWARNSGAAAANGEFLAFLDSDDIWYPPLLERQVSALVDFPPNVGMVCCGLIRKQGDTCQVLIPGTRGLSFDENLIFGNGICTSSFLVRKTAFQAVGGFSVEFSSFQDFDFLLRMTAKYQVASIDEVLMEYRLGNDSISLNMDSKARGFATIIHTYRSDILRLGLMSAYMFRLGQYHVLAGRLAVGWRYWAQAWRPDPWNIKIGKHFFLTLGGVKFYRHLLLVHQRHVAQRDAQDNPSGSTFEQAIGVPYANETHT